MSTPARKIIPAAPAPTDAEIAAAIERARLPDGTVDPFLLGIELSAPLNLNYDHDNPHERNHHLDDA